MDFHCSGSWPTWMASVANDLNAVLKPSNTSARSSFVWFCSMTLRFPPLNTTGCVCMCTRLLQHVLCLLSRYAARKKPFNAKCALRSSTWANQRQSTSNGRRWLVGRQGQCSRRVLRFVCVHYMFCMACPGYCVRPHFSTTEPRSVISARKFGKIQEFH